MTAMRTCTKCLSSKATSEFYPAKCGRGGLQSDCKECRKIAVRAHRLNNLDRARAYDRQRGKLAHRVALSVAVTKRARSDYPERYRAQTAVNNALRDGRLRSQPCWVCGNKAIAHHPDYSRPLDVVWLCQPHHKAAHAAIGA